MRWQAKVISKKSLRRLGGKAAVWVFVSEITENFVTSNSKLAWDFDLCYLA